ncbi:PROTEIN EMBRYONIC FLOWER 1 [Salix koriyanagi]|uniref:PROTEIN EMBRYONIC FLOWER 1 n=1 Tax=Salix koriyanagi TaxID=2511006 RepID=A0A9Q0VC25_9ROSI|nr:PROTEIN EMBRYONIC FLOWER 1 [Salix koriyanagi]
MMKAAEIEQVGNFNFTSRNSQDAPFEKGIHSDPSTRRPSFKIPFLSEKQKYTSQVEIGGCSLIQKKDFCSTKSNEKTVGMQEHSAFPRKYTNHIAGKVSEQGALDDIPMEIVELMAKNQYERCLSDGEYEKHQETTQKENPPARRNGVIKIGEPTKQKAVDFFSQADRNSFGMRATGKNWFPCGTGDVVGNRSCYANFHTPGPRNTCQSIPQQSKEADHLWSSMMSNHMPFVYSIPPKCVTQSTNVDVFPHSSGSMLKENMNGDRELKFLNKNAANLGKQNRNFGSETLIRARAEYPFTGKHNGIELNQKPMGSLDLYSNETIPAMHLLSLMDAGVQSSAPVNMDVNSKVLKRPSILQNPEPKEFPRLDNVAFKAVNTVKHPTV